MSAARALTAVAVMTLAAVVLVPTTRLEVVLHGESVSQLERAGQEE